MALWQLVQQNSDALCSEGLRALLMAEPLEPSSEVPERAGIYLFFADPETFFLGETENLRKTLSSQTNPLHSSFYKAYRKRAGANALNLTEFTVRCLPVSFCRHELLNYAEAHLPALAQATFRSDKKHFAMAGASVLWDRVQGIAPQLIADCGRDALIGDAVRFGGPAKASGPGLHVIFAEDEEVLFVSAFSDVAQAYRDHLRNTVQSRFRQNIAEGVFGLKLQTKPGKIRKLTEIQEREISDYVRKCRIIATPMRAGRLEVERDLIERLRPMLNFYQEKGPYARMTPLYAARHRKAVFG